MNLNPTNVLIIRNDPESFFNNDPIDETSDDESCGLISNILLINFCQASQFTKKIKFTNQEKNEDGSVVNQSV